MPCVRQAPRIVVPAGTVTASPSIVSEMAGGASTPARCGGRLARAGGVTQDVGQRLRRSPVRRRRPRAGAGSRSMLRPSLTGPPYPAAADADSIADDAVWPRPQIDASRIAWPISRSSASSSSREPDPRAGRQAGQQLLLADGPDPARDALAARLVAEELGDPAERVDQVGGLVEDHDHARPERRAGGPSRLEGQRHVERVGPDEDARRAAEQDRPDRAVAGHAAGELDQVAQRRPELDLVDAGSATWPDRQNSFGPVEPSVPIRANASPPSRDDARARWPASRRC